MLRQLECTRVRSVGAVWKLGPSASQGWRFSVLVRNEDEGLVCVRVGNYELNDEFKLKPGEHVLGIDLNLSPRAAPIDDILELIITSDQGQTVNFAGGGAASTMTAIGFHPTLEESYATGHCRPGEVIRSFYGRVKWVAPDRWSRTQGLHQAHRILCALGVVYGPEADAAWSPRAPERFSDAATARANAVLALASADRGPLSRLPEVVVHHVLGFAIALFK